MKKLSIFLFLSVFAMLVSCSDDDSQSLADPQPVINAAKLGNWRVTYYSDSGTDKTAQFSGFTFTFGEGNALSATNGTATHTGTWSVTNSHSGTDDSGHHSSNDLDFNIAFTAPANFLELTDDWDIRSYSANKIELIDISGGNGGTDYLTFERNQQ